MDLFAVIVWCANKVFNNSHLIDKSGGVLSVDTAGPFVRAYDAGGYKTAYILVGALTWTVPKGSPLKEDDVEGTGKRKHLTLTRRRVKNKTNYKSKVNQLAMNQSKASSTTLKMKMKNLKFKKPQKAKWKRKKKKQKKKRR